MFFFRKKRDHSKSLIPFLSGIETDIHSHLIPGIDDGVPDVATSVDFISQLHELGIRKIITTPHIMMDRFPNSQETIHSPYLEVEAALASQRINVPFNYAAEYYMDEQFEALLKSPLLTLNGRLVLVEISFVAPPPQMHQWLFEMSARGYMPLLAHPERYNYCHKNFNLYKEFKSWGCQLQLNLLSLTGYYGKAVQQAAFQLLDANMIDYIGTDLHHEKHMQAIRDIAENKKLLKRLEQYPFKNNSLTATR